jgi:hypothetical protein
MRLAQVGLNRRLKEIKAARAHIARSNASGLETSSKVTDDRIVDQSGSIVFAVWLGMV